jgi:hypothetical protein
LVRRNSPKASRPLVASPISVIDCSASRNCLYPAGTPTGAHSPIHSTAAAAEQQQQECDDQYGMI